MKDSARPRLRDLILLKNPLILASGPPGRTAKSLINYGQTAGGVVAKSVTWLPQKGNPKPRLTRVRGGGIINWEDFPNPGYRAFQDEIKKAKDACDCPVVASIAPLVSVEQQRTVAAAFQGSGVDAIELDFKWAGHEKEGLLTRIIKGVKEVVSIPVIVKLSPFVGDITENALIAEQAGADALTAINTVYPAMRINCRLQRPAIVTGFGGLSGAPILPIAVAMVYQIYRVVDIPLLGSGGVTSGEDALEMIMAGAEAVQLCAAAMLEGPDVFKRINSELETLIEELDLGSVEECVGLAHQHPLFQPQGATIGDGADQK